jgi:putative Ca2+/H+ antiporter (TMEM165/GDT1 family)
MDIKTFFATFTALFLAEMGDKTQLAVISLSASSRKPLSVFLGGAAALVALTALGAVFGGAVARLVPEGTLQKGAAILFVILGVWMWFKG